MNLILGDKHSRKLKRRKVPYPASTRNLKSKHQKLGLFGGANKIKFQTELGYKNPKKSSALNLLRSNTDFRNFGKSKTGKLGFNSNKRTGHSSSLLYLILLIIFLYFIYDYNFLNFKLSVLFLIFQKILL